MPHAEWAIAPELLWGYRRLLLNRTMPYALQLADGSYRWIDRRSRWQVVQAHLLGQQTIASSSLDASGWCRWVCLDADAADGLSKLVGIAQALYDLGFPPVLEASRRGGHLWLFLEAPAPATLARRMTLGVLARLAADGVPMTPLEIYPKTDVGLGHGVRLPLECINPRANAILCSTSGDALSALAPLMTPSPICCVLLVWVPCGCGRSRHRRRYHHRSMCPVMAPVRQ